MAHVDSGTPGVRVPEATTQRMPGSDTAMNTPRATPKSRSSTSRGPNRLATRRLCTQRTAANAPSTRPPNVANSTRMATGLDPTPTSPMARCAPPSPTAKVTPSPMTAIQAM